ncbi:Wadjet anti-phage system protein JetD domain-containing protein [Pseudomonas aeruginosa]
MVLFAGRSENPHRGLAAGLQRTPTAQRDWQSHPGRNFAASWRTRQQQLKQEKLISTPGPTNYAAVLKLGAVTRTSRLAYGLPELPGTIAVFGGGANTAWLQAEWLKDRRIGYWGDLDTWGLKFLADARLRQPHVEAVMMDRDTLIAHVERGVCEERPAELPDYGLTLAERSLFEELRSWSIRSWST